MASLETFTHGWDSKIEIKDSMVNNKGLIIQRPGISIVGQLTESVESLFLIHQGGYHDLFVCP